MLEQVYGLTKDGFKRKPYTVILEEKQERAKDLFGEDIDLSERSPLGLYIQTDAWEESILWEQMEHVYYAAFIDDAEGKQLDALVKFIGLFRRPALRSRGKLEIIGRVGQVIAQGTRFMTASGIVFKTREVLILDLAGQGIVDIEALESGWRGNITANQIDRLFTSTEGGITNITNPERTSGGMPVETDEELRERYYRSLSRKGKATRAAIEAAILELPTVKDAKVLENSTMEVDENGLPPKCIAPFIFDGDPLEIAAAVLNTKSGGIQSYGEVIIDVYDSRGHPHKIGITKATAKNIYVRITLVRNPNFRPGYEATIRTNVITYIGGLDIGGVEFNGLGLGQSVIHSRIVAITSDRGITDATIELSVDGEIWAGANIDLPFMQIAITDYTRVIVI